jgi:hypothetical protein
MSIDQVSLDAIRIGERIRHDFGDIDALAENIADVGLLHPVVLTPDYDLISGHRRILAYRKLKQQSIPARILDIDSIVKGEYAENELRKDFTLSERFAIFEKLHVPRQGQRTDQLQANWPEVSGTQTRDIAAKQVGLKPTTARRIGATVANGAPELVAAMDSGKLAPSVTAKLATLPLDEQRRLAAASKKEARAAVETITGKAAAPGDRNHRRGWHGLIVFKEAEASENATQIIRWFGEDRATELAHTLLQMTQRKAS